MLWNYRSGGDDGPLADPGIVEDGRTDANQNHIFQDAAVYGGIVPDGHQLAYDYRIEIAHAMQDGAVLYIALGTDADRIYIASDDGVHPDTGLFAEDNVTYDLRRGVDVTGGRNFRFVRLVATNHETNSTFGMQKISEWYPTSNYQRFMCFS